MIHPSSGIPVNSLLANDPIPFFIYVFRTARAILLSDLSRTNGVCVGE